MLINYIPGEECRIAIVEDGRLEELYQERASADLHVGNIYNGRVVSVEPSIQAAFIDFGLDRNGFLHISDLHPMYFRGDWKEESERVGQKTPHRDRPPIQTCLRRGQEILVQVLKEGIGTKGPTLTSYLSIPGRFVVMMPNMERLGVSRKVEDEDARREMRKVLDELDPPQGFGFIIRTAGIGRTKVELKRDLAYLHRLWKNIEQRRRQMKKNVGELYTEADLIIRTIRDVFSKDIHRIMVDDLSAARRAEQFLAVASPRSSSKVFVYHDPIPLFHRYGIEDQIENINVRDVPLPSGGSLVIDPTEALVAIDVNSGKNRENRDAETTAYKTNIEAVDEICRQLRLRDLGGVVVMDLIDMRLSKHRREIEQRIRTNLKNDRARTRISSISPFGLLEMTRQRMRPSLKKSIHLNCSHCDGTGYVKSPQSVVLDVLRRLALTFCCPEVVHVELTVSPDAAFYLLNQKRSQLVALERRHGKPITVRVGGHSIDYIQLTAFDADAAHVDVTKTKPDSDPKLLSTKAASELPADTSIDTGLTEDDSAAQGETSASLAADYDGDSPSEALEDSDRKPTRRRRRRRGGRRRGQKTASAPASDAGQAETDAPSHDGQEDTPLSSTQDTINESEEKTSGDQSQSRWSGEASATADAPITDQARIDSPDPTPSAGDKKPKRRRRRRRSSRSQSEAESGSVDASSPSTEQAAHVEEDQTTGASPSSGSQPTIESSEAVPETVAKKPKRRGRSRPRRRTSDGSSPPDSGIKLTVIEVETPSIQEPTVVSNAPPIDSPS